MQQRLRGGGVPPAPRVMVQSPGCALAMACGPVSRPGLPGASPPVCRVPVAALRTISGGRVHMGPAVLGPICLGAVTPLAGPSRRWRRAVLTAAWPARGLHVPRASVPTFAVKPVLDFAYWAEHAEEAQRNADNRRFKCDVQAVVAAHSEYRAQLHEIKLARERRNAHSRLLKGKLAPEERQRLIEEGREIKDRLLELEASAAELGERLTAQALPIPNRSHPAVPVGAEEAAVVRRTCGTPRTSATVG